MRSQVSSHPVASFNNSNSDLRNDRSNTIPLHENEGIDDHQVPDHVGDLDGSTAVQNQHVASDTRSGWRGQVAEVDRQLSHMEPNEWAHRSSEDTDPNWQDNAVSGWPSEAFATENQGQRHLQEAIPNVASGEAVETWSESDPPRMLRPIPSRRVSRFNLPNDDNMYTTELRELLSRLFLSMLCVRLSWLLVLVDLK